MERLSRLQMDFKNTAGKNARLTVDQPKADLTPEVVHAAMEGILAQDVFSSKSGDLASIVGAQIVTTTTQELI